MQRCVHRWKVETNYDWEEKGWHGTCANCGAKKLFPLRDLTESDNYRYWRRGPTKLEEALE